MTMETALTKVQWGERSSLYSWSMNLAFTFKAEISLSTMNTTGKVLKRQRTNLSWCRTAKQHQTQSRGQERTDVLLPAQQAVAPAHVQRQLWVSVLC